MSNESTVPPSRNSIIARMEGAAEVAASFNRGLVKIRPAWQLFLDMDGVLVDFVKHFRQTFGMSPREFEKERGSAIYWEYIRSEDEFYNNTPLMMDAHELIKGVEHLRPIILTGVPRGGWAERQKIEFAQRHFPGIPIVPCRSEHKSLYCKPGDVLVDDWAHYAEKWKEAGGIFVMHTSAEDSLLKLKELGKL